MPNLIIPGQFASLSEISAFSKKAAQDAGLNEFDIYAVETAVDEACSNIIEHAYQGQKEGIITIDYRLTPDDLIFTITDTGHPFDPNSISKPDLNCNLEKRKESGLGLYIMHQWMDEVKFKFSKGHNILTMTKHRGK
jgi:serine/threonine-protein kinase RsbW